MTIHIADTERFAGHVRFVTHHGDRQFGWQTGNKVRPDLCRVNGVGRGAVHHKQHAVGLLDLLPGAFDTDALNLVAGIAQTGGIDDVQRHAVDVDVLAQHVASGTGNVGHDRCFTARQGVQQARFTGVRASGNHHLHPFTQQAALARFCTNGVEIGHHLVELGFDFAVREEVDLLVREVDSRFHVDPKVSKCFHEVIHTRGECALQRVQSRAGRLFRTGVDQVSNGLSLRQVELVVEEGTLGELARLGNAQARQGQDTF